MMYRKLTAEQRYTQAVRLAHRQHLRASRDFVQGRCSLFHGPSGMDRERQTIIREIGRVYEAGREAGRAER